jgi:hypothetical protein
MSVSMRRLIICWILIAVTPATAIAADTDSGSAAMLYGKGTVWLNGKPLPRSSAVFPGDLIETRPESIATLDASGSGVVVFPDSLIKFEANAISLERGGASVATSKGMVALVQQVTVTPASDTWTEFEVVDTNGKIQVFGSKGTVNVNCGKDTTRLSEGDEATPDQSGHCNKKKRKGGAPLPGGSPVLTNPFVLGGAVVTGGGVACLLLCNSSKSFVSPWKP